MPSFTLNTGDSAPSFVELMRALAEEGESLYKELLPRHLSRLQERFERMSSADQRRATRLLEAIAEAFSED